MPLMICPAKLNAVAGLLELSPAGLVKPSLLSMGRQCRVTESGIAILPVTGTLVRRGSLLSEILGFASYQDIAEMAEDAFTDPAVSGVLLDIDSYGGEASGLFDLAAELRSMSGTTGKPLWAHANESALSAAYGIACSADRIWVAQTAEAGSVGVVALHIDQSKADADAGLAYTYVYGGAHKTEGNPHESLSDGARERLQADVDSLYGKFCSMVAEARHLPVEAVRNTEAGIYRGADAVDIGFADHVGTLRQAHDAMAEYIHQNKAARGRLFHALEGAMNEEAMEKLKAEIEADAISRMTELNGIAAQAKRLGVDIDPAEAMRNGITPDALRKQVLEQAAAIDRSTDIVAAVASPDAPKNDDRLIAAVRKLNGGK